MSLVHYRAVSEDTGVVCGVRSSELTFTRVFGYVTCFACRRHPTFRLDQLETDVRPSVLGTIGRIRQVLREYDQAMHTAEDALSIIESIIEGKEE